ncbi:MAG: hypothetical protein A2X05_11735 [Bacteroidetes bacterium GWE2_41_25]|nr:MAG: hypothetical protein A2X03_11465 [Bacteroidetes bacterium GWA2_40_15]OFX92580.1 MAG: hypothetical protein A2X06_17885 [Bacteroidetes bacterium GWC2_40_22]OFY04982.1 MAG: hypothetical protein A2X05_11735 [Bacteroidetes bacterium GWE2_41_25]HBH84211.1 hypothetical protein [Bacteroidales bacterium]HBQ83737.1 hypothetical protein [Bacteroidales bacterium]
MNNFSLAREADIKSERRVKRNLSIQNNPVEILNTGEAINKLISEGGDSFYNYVEWIGLLKDPDLIVLSSLHHYFFDNEDLKNTKTIINLKQLNLIKEIDIFFHSIFKIAPPKSNFIGCFLDNKTQYEFSINNIISQYHSKNNVDPFENGIKSRNGFLNSVYNLLDSRTDRYLTKSNVSSLLKRQGFKVMDMTKLNGLTYFHSQKSLDSMN